MGIPRETYSSPEEEIKALHNSLDAEIHRSEAILSCMKEGILAVDERGTILKVNLKAREMLNLVGVKARGRHVHEVCYQSELLGFINSGLSTRDLSEREIKLLSHKEIIAMASRSPMFSSGGEFIGMVVVLNDITQLRRLENVRRDFASNVSHELRTPITSIRGFVETLLNGAISEPESARRFLEIINKHASRLSSIIEDLLTLSSLEKGGDIELAILPVLDVIRKAVERMSTKADEKHIKVRMDCDPKIEAMINGAFLETAVSNLVDNAINYSEDGREVLISASLADSMITITVKDQGYGIEEQHLARIFERFYRVDTARSRKAGGTGLGLSIVKHVVLAHKGKVDVKSKPGEGSEFIITIPANNAQ